jgi:hypothetical protein
METVKFFVKNNAALAAAVLGFSVVTASVPAFADTTISIAATFRPRRRDIKAS